MSDASKWREKWDKAVEKDRPKDALLALLQLEKLEPKEPRWAQRAGDMHRRLGQTAEAEAAFVRALDGYRALGLLPRAVALAKTIVQMNPARVDVLSRVDPNFGKAAVPILPKESARPERVSLVDAALPLSPAVESKEDEVRFSDAPSEAGFDIDLSDVAVVDVEGEPDEQAYAERLSSMAACTLFASFPQAAFTKLAESSELVTLAAGTSLIVKDTPADALFAITEGKVEVTISGLSPIVLSEGEVCGEACLLDEGRRQATVRARTPLEALKISRDALRDIAGEFPEVEDALFRLLVRRLLGNVVQTAELFSAFDPTTRLELARLFEVRKAAAGTVLAKQGKKSDGLYLLLAGDVTLDGDRGKRVRRGTLFGHEALVSQLPSEHTLTAVGEAIVLRLPAQKFATLAATYPPALMHLSELGARPQVASMPPGASS